MPLAFSSRGQGKRVQGHTLHARQPLPARRGAVLVRAERSYVMVKPDGVQRGIVGNVITRFENKGFKMVGLKMYQTSKAVAEEHYKDLSEKPFYGKLVDYIVSGPVVCIVRPCCHRKARSRVPPATPAGTSASPFCACGRVREACDVPCT